MSFFVWYTIRCGDIMLIALPTLCIWAILNVSISRFSTLFPHQARDDIHLPISSSFCKHVFPFYSVLTHAIGIGFQPRVCWAIRESTRKLQLSGSRSSEQSRRESTMFHSRPSSRSSISQGSSDSESWDSTTDTKAESGLVIHAIRIPNYKEDYYVPNETLNVLACHPQAKDSDDMSLRFGFHRTQDPD